MEEKEQFQQWKATVLKNLLLQQRGQAEEAYFEHAVYTAKETYLTLLSQVRDSCLQELERYIEQTYADPTLSDTTKALLEINLLQSIDKLEQKQQEFKELRTKVATLTRVSSESYMMKNDLYQEYLQEYLTTGQSRQAITEPVFTIIHNEENLAKRLVSYGLFSHVVINKLPEETHTYHEDRPGVWRYADDTITVFSTIVGNLTYCRYLRPQRPLDSSILFDEKCTLTLQHSPRLSNVTFVLPLNHIETTEIRTQTDIFISYVKKMHTLYQVTSNGTAVHDIVECIVPQLQEVVTLFPF